MISRERFVCFCILSYYFLQIFLKRFHFRPILQVHMHCLNRQSSIFPFQTSFKAFFIPSSF